MHSGGRQPTVSTETTEPAKSGLPDKAAAAAEGHALGTAGEASDATASPAPKGANHNFATLQVIGEIR